MIEDNKLIINEKLYGYDGVIGRHAYLLNFVIISAISSLIMLPYSGYIFTHINSFMDLFNLPKLFISTPLLLKIWVVAGVSAMCILSLSNMFRRLNDIFGEVKQNINIVLGVVVALSMFSFLFPIFAAILLYIANFIIYLVLFFKKGKITSVLPYDYKKEFNWGAFFGTWIWGLFNDSYITLWALLLMFTPIFFYFQMYCGLKGNEWAYNSKNYEDVEKFNKSQKTQTLVFVLLNVVVIPVLYILLILGLIFGFSFLISSIGVNQGNHTPQVEHKVDNFMTGFASLFFEKYTITPEENKFYVSPEDWSSSSFNDKKDILDLAASSAAFERRKNYVKTSDKHEYFSKTSELPRTKIYSSTSEQLLGEFILDKNFDDENASFKDFIKAAFNAYRFYNVEK